jgi:uncharacterized protein
LIRPRARGTPRPAGLPFELTRDEFDWNAALVVEDARRDYGERRFLAIASMQGRLHVVCYCRRGEARRIISFRKANKKEERAYDQASIEAVGKASDR